METVGFGIYGTTDRQYTSLISFGGFYGRSEVFGESGYTSNTTPLFTQTHEAAFQESFVAETCTGFRRYSSERLPDVLEAALLLPSPTLLIQGVRWVTVQSLPGSNPDFFRRWNWVSH